jgi:hypothetical protein
VSKLTSNYIRPNTIADFRKLLKKVFSTILPTVHGRAWLSCCQSILLLIDDAGDAVEEDALAI